ncbi:MAG TPA: hydrogenase maturation protease [Clostridiales bacterium]|nr:hydrogenase maturation protease [Clostridiales bacterium]
MKRVLVIGIGCLMMMDDGIGSRVVEALESEMCKHNIASFAGETDFQCCFDEIKPGDLVVIIDAMVQGNQPGSIDIMLLRDVFENLRKFRSQHEFSLFDLIKLHAPQTEGYLIGIEPAEINFELDLSAPLKELFDQICSNVLNTILHIKEEAEDA